MTDSINMAVQKRDVFGKKLRTLRRAGYVPAVLHNHGQDSIHVSIEEKALQKVYNEAGKHHPLEISIEGGDKHTALIKDVNFEPAKAKMRHVVFQLVRANEKVEALIPLELIGEIPAEKVGLQVIEQLKEVEVRGIPKNLVDKIEVDASVLVEEGDTIMTSSLVLPEGLELVSDTVQLIASVEAPIDQLAVADEAAAELAEEAGTPEIVEATDEQTEVKSEDNSDNKK